MSSGVTCPLWNERAQAESPGSVALLPASPGEGAAEVRRVEPALLLPAN